MKTRNAGRLTLEERRERLFAAGIVLAGLLLRLALWGTQPFVSVDGTTYIRLARAMAGGVAFDSVMPPGYPALILIFQVVVRDWVIAARVADLAAGLALIPLTWLLARAYVSRWWLRLAPALAVAALPLPVRYSLTTMSEAPYLALLLGAFVLAARRRDFLTGFLGGLAYLVRPEALTATLALALVRWRRPRRAALVLGGLALVVAPTLVIQGATSGVWSITRKTNNLGGSEWWQNEPLASGAAQPEAAADRLREYGSESLASYPRRLAGYAVHTVRHGGWIVPVLGLAGLASPAAPLGAGLLQFLITPAFALGNNPRFILPYLPFLWILAAVFLDRAGRRARLGLGALALAGLVATGIVEAPGYHVQEDGTYPELVETGRWLEPHVRPGTVIYDRKPYAAFYAGATYRAIPLGTYDEMLDAIVRDGGDFLVVDQAVVDFFRPALLPLALDKGVVGNESRLRPVYLNLKYRDRATVVYRVIRPGGPKPLPDERGIKEQLAQITHQENHFPHGILAMRGEHWQVAAGEFAYAISADSTNAAAFNNRAWCLLQADMALPNAESDARHATALEPENPDYLDTLIAVLRRVGKHEEADRLGTRLEALEARRAGR